MNITLIGMPGSGKSFVGQKLAEQLGYELIELDSILEMEAGLPLQKVIEQWGEKAFLEKQARATLTHTRGRQKIIISPGGSIVYTKKAMSHLKQISKVICLDTPLSLIEERIGTTPRRVIGLKGSLFQLHSARMKLYRKWADYVIDGDQEVREVVSSILLVLNLKALGIRTT